MSTQDVTESNCVDDVDFVPSTNIQEVQSLDNRSDVNESRGIKRKKTSPAWDHFTLQKIDGKLKAVCNHCGRKLVGESSKGTKHLLLHMERCPVRQKQLAKNPTASPSVTFNLDPELGRKKLAEMIILHEYPLSMVEHSGFIDYSNTISPMFQMVSRNTIRSDILKIYKIEKEKFREVLEKNKSRIALTTDMWTANHQKRGYMAVTAHFIDDSWKLHSQIISFRYVPCPHDAPTLTETLSSCMSEWNIEQKISTVTVDNCTTNDAMIPLLKEQFDSKCFLLNGKLLHMRFCAHILNLIVRDGLSVIGDSIDKIRDSVAYWLGTPKKYEKFEDTARLLGVTCTKKLSLDCVTWLNSTYLMLKTALLYKKVFERSELRDPKYKCLPSDNDWIRAQKLCDKLEVFYEVTVIFWN
ncbi:zinc finger BED domain-containing protein RICESLEEPER 2-like [Humulus lupulus]|uniref:zinc finger BED domain-containing protein RICESLEEPER 2-like n=1 Tax=Humulus lupulus TaxID=3486 RepID=UPI002B40050D|nr:zinc finger BED domain-containing protein RICESLEEPER 2-like [Humulus lupulus]